jgi:23S rRNA (cytosine1962-C5)-methyltransferase
MIRIKISKTLEQKIRRGYPWVFHYQIQNEQIDGELGDLAVVYDSKNLFLAIGLYDPESDIRLRVLQTSKPVDIDSVFFEKRLLSSIQLRESLLDEGTTTAYRVINGENDGFPGLILDRYENTLVLKLYTYAWIPYLDILMVLFKKNFMVNRCVLRLSRKVAELKNISKKYREGVILFGCKITKPIYFKENGIDFQVDVISGQKTGFYLDQRENRQKIRLLSKGKSVLNVFSYTGAFSVYAFAGGASSVLEIDSNAIALAASRQNLRTYFGDRNFSMEEFDQMLGDGFDMLSKLESAGRQYDLVILDPPAFAKRKKQKKIALNSYKKLVQAGAKVTKRGGILFGASCSVHVQTDDFYKAVFSGIHSTGREYEEIGRTSHAKDHPFIFKEGEYLKGIFCKIA